MKLTKTKSIINEEIEHVNKDVIDRTKIDDTIVTTEPVSFTSAVKEAQETRKRAKEVYDKLQSKADFFAKHQTGVKESVKHATKKYLTENFEGRFNVSKVGYSVFAKDRKELGKLIAEARSNNLSVKVGKSLKEDYRYRVSIDMNKPLKEDYNSIVVLLKNGNVKYYEFDDEEETEAGAVQTIVDNIGDDVKAIYRTVTNSGPVGELWKNDSLKENFRRYPNSMYVAIPLSDFRPWGQAKDTLQTIIDNDKFDAFENYLLDICVDNVIDETELNDWLAFDSGSLLDDLGITEEEDDFEEEEEEE